VNPIYPKINANVYQAFAYILGEGDYSNEMNSCEFIKRNRRQAQEVKSREQLNILLTQKT
jgi:hypothetical protein